MQRLQTANAMIGELKGGLAPGSAWVLEQEAVMEVLDVRGRWWLPSAPGAPVSGRLSLTETGPPQLVLDGELDQRARRNDFVPRELILGETNGGVLFSLLWCQCIGRVHGRHGVSEETHSVSGVLRGVHLDRPDEPCFDVLRVTFSRLPLWATADAIEMGRSGEWADDNTRVLARLRRGVMPLTARLDDATVELRNECPESLSIGDALSYEASIEPAFEVRCEEPLAIGQWEERYVRPLLDLVTLATDGSNATATLTFFESGNSDAQPADLLRGRAISAEPSGSSSVLFRAKDVSADYPAMIGNWLKAHADLRSACDMYFGLLRAPFTYNETRFIMLVFAAEIYHRRRLNSSSKVALKTRLEDLFAAQSVVTDPLVPGGGTASRWPIEDAIVKERTRVAHGKLPGAALPGGLSLPLHRLSAVLDVLLKSRLLSEAGFALDRQLEWFQRDSRYTSLVW
jgi:hypothetical protein